MATQSRPLVVLAGPINPDGKSLLEREARVVEIGRASCRERVFRVV